VRRRDFLQSVPIMATMATVAANGQDAGAFSIALQEAGVDSEVVVRRDDANAAYPISATLAVPEAHSIVYCDDDTQALFFATFQIQWTDSVSKCWINVDSSDQDILAFHPVQLHRYDTNTVTFPIPSPTRVRKHTLTLRWLFSAEDPPTQWREFAKTVHIVYAVLSKPTFPWLEGVAIVRVDNPTSGALDLACRWADGATNAVDAIALLTRGVHSLGKPNAAGIRPFVYDRAYRYIAMPDRGKSPTYGYFDLNGFIRDVSLRDTVTTVVKINCTDCAVAITTLANAIGCDVSTARLSHPSGEFGLNPMIPIGGTDDDWKFWGPEHASPDDGFSYHDVAWLGQLDSDGLVFDACVRLSGAEDPASDTPSKPTLATGLRFGSSNTDGYFTRLIAPRFRDSFRVWPSVLDQDDRFQIIFSRRRFNAGFPQPSPPALAVQPLVQRQTAQAGMIQPLRLIVGLAASKLPIVGASLTESRVGANNPLRHTEALFGDSAGGQIHVSVDTFDTALDAAEALPTLLACIESARFDRQPDIADACYGSPHSALALLQLANLLISIRTHNVSASPIAIARQIGAGIISTAPAPAKRAVRSVPAIGRFTAPVARHDAKSPPWTMLEATGGSLFLFRDVAILAGDTTSSVSLASTVHHDATMTTSRTTFSKR
jgi:hypothetical protein